MDFEQKSFVYLENLVDDRFPQINIEKEKQQLPAVRPSISENSNLECDKLLLRIQDQFLKQELVSIMQLQNLFLNVLEKFKDEYDIAGKRSLNIKLPKLKKEKIENKSSKVKDSSRLSLHVDLNFLK